MYLSVIRVEACLNENISDTPVDKDIQNVGLFIMFIISCLSFIAYQPL